MKSIKTKLLPIFVLSFAVCVYGESIPPSPDLSILDSKADPCENFYQYACGGWISKNSIPADLASWDRSFSTISEQNQILLREVLEKYARGVQEPANPYAEKLGDFYGSCMAEADLETESMKGLGKRLAEIDSLKKENLPGLIASLHLKGIDVLFSFYNTQDFKNPQNNIAEMNQGGMGLPSKEYYLDSSEKMKKFRAQYLQHIQKMMLLIKENSKSAKIEAQQILKLETQLAEAALAPQEMRDPTKLYHIQDFSNFAQSNSALAWQEFGQAMGLGKLGKVNFPVPAFFDRLKQVIETTPFTVLKNYLKYKLVLGSSKALPERFAEEAFSFYGKTLYGIQSLAPRWKRCVKATNEAMGFALGRSYVDLQFAGESKKIALGLMEKIEKEQAQLISGLTWMDAATKEAAQLKLKSLINQIGYPDRWRNYETLKTQKKAYLENRFASSEFNAHYELAKIGTPLDRTDWGMTPSQVNAYYDASQGKMVFPAGILQPPFFNSKYSASANFAGIGMVMGHELSHGFDDEGRQFDAKGAMQDWWTAQSAKEFEKRTQCLSEQFDSYPAAGGGHVSGKLTLGEDMGDQGGLKLSYLAWKNTLNQEVKGHAEFFHEAEKSFFLSFAQSWCGKSSEAFEQVLVKTNPHPPMRYRVIGAVSNLPAFAEAYQCKAGSPMAPVKRCEVW